MKTITLFNKPFHYRENTWDECVINEVIYNRNTYPLFSMPDAKTIIDVGANIGAASVLFAHHYPTAKIHAFEPETENFKLLLKNTETYPNIICHNYALGLTKEKRTLFASDTPQNKGGYSLCPSGVDLTTGQSVQVECLSEYIENQADIDTIDILKLDCEGSEADIIFDIYALLPDVKIIMGEAHGIDDFMMFKDLSGYFELAYNKSLGQRNYPFLAVRKDLK